MVSKGLFKQLYLSTNSNAPGWREDGASFKKSHEEDEAKTATLLQPLGIVSAALPSPFILAKKIMLEEYTMAEMNPI